MKEAQEGFPNQRLARSHGGRLLPGAGGSEAGAAYVVALMVLVILTILGLGLAIVTQTEMQVGANEKTLQRVFYAADSGISAAITRAMVEAYHESEIYNLDDPDSPPGVTVVHEITTSPFHLLLRAPCDLCQINNTGQYGAQQYFNVNYAVTARAKRKAGSMVLADKELSSMVEIQPYPVPIESLEAIQDPSELAKIRF
jgi:hypothetical protein